MTKCLYLQLLNLIHTFPYIGMSRSSCNFGSVSKVKRVSYDFLFIRFFNPASGESFLKPLSNISNNKSVVEDLIHFLSHSDNINSFRKFSIFCRYSLKKFSF